MFSLFGKKRSRSAIVIDIGSSSIGGAYASFPADGSPLVPFSVREEIMFPSDKRSELCMFRAFETVVSALHASGRPAFHRATGMDHVDRVFIAIGAPWQNTRIENQTISDGKTFTFTRDMLASTVGKREKLPEGRKELQNEVVATLLNGYQTTDPYGKRAERAEVILLSSSMDGDTMDLLSRSVKRFGAHQGSMLAPSESLAHAVLRAQYPHDKDFLLMTVSDEATSVMIANRGIILDATSVPIGLHVLTRATGAMKALRVNEGVPALDAAPTEAPSLDEGTWTTGVTGVLREFATRHALPRMVFLVASDGSADSLKRFLDTPEMHSLWLSDESLTIIPVVSKLLSSFISHQGQGDADVMLDLLTLFAQLRLNATP